MPKIVELKPKNKKSFESFDTFSETESDVLKAWNRCATFFNIIKHIDLDNAKSYAAQFEKSEREKMSRILTMIRDDGYENTKRKVINGTMTFLGEVNVG